MAKWDNYIYTYVSRSAVSSILSDGLYGSEAMLNRADILASAAKSRNISPANFKRNIEKDLKDTFTKPVLLGPNIVFQLIPDLNLVSKKQPVRKNHLVPIKINLTQLLYDEPDTEIFGMELKPYAAGQSIKDRSHFLSSKELRRLLSLSPREIWKSYNDIEDKGLYAPDVPHASIHTANGIIAPKYLQIVKKSSTEEVDGLLKLAVAFYTRLAT